MGYLSVWENQGDFHGEVSLRVKPRKVIALGQAESEDSRWKMHYEQSQMQFQAF